MLSEPIRLRIDISGCVHRKKIGYFVITMRLSAYMEMWYQHVLKVNKEDQHGNLARADRCLSFVGSFPFNQSIPSEKRCPVSMEAHLLTKVLTVGHVKTNIRALL